MRSENPGAVVSGALLRLEPLRSVRTDALEVAYFEAGPSDGEVALLLHGFPYDIHSYIDVIPRLVEAGHRVIASDTHPATLRTTRSSRSLLRSRPSRSRLSPWMVWQMATSRQLTAARLPVTSPGPACTTRCPTRVTTFPRSLQTRSPARSWNWHIFDHTPAECEALDFFGSNGFRAIAHDRRGRGHSSQPWNGNDLDTKKNGYKHF